MSPLKNPSRCDPCSARRRRLDDDLIVPNIGEEDF